jgi:DNA-binding winged helix-turn-helix (wHTH) protein
MARRPNTVISDADIVTTLLRDVYHPGCTIVRAHVCRLRKKLGATGRLIRTVRGCGHRLAVSPHRCRSAVSQQCNAITTDAPEQQVQNGSRGRGKHPQCKASS